MALIAVMITDKPKRTNTNYSDRRDLKIKEKLVRDSIFPMLDIPDETGMQQNMCVFHFFLKKKTFEMKNGANRPTNYSSMAGWRGDLLKLCHPSTGYLYQNQLYNNYIGTR